MAQDSKGMGGENSVGVGELGVIGAGWVQDAWAVVAIEVEAAGMDCLDD